MKSSEIVEIVEAELAKRKISKTEFYKQTGITSAVFSYWRNNLNFPKQESLRKIEDFLGISFDMSVNESLRTREMLFENDEQRILFEASKGAPKSAMLEAAALIQRYKEMGK